MSIEQSAIIEVLNKVQDPDIGLSLGDLKAIEKIEIDGNHVKIYLKLVQPIYWAASPINESCINELRKLSDSHTFEIIISEQHFESSNRPVLPGVKNIIAVSSGKGGVGKSAVASNLAAALASKGAKVGILDADVYGPSQPTMFGAKGTKLEAVRTEDGKTYAKPAERYGIQVASMGFLMEQQDAAIVRGPMLAGYFSMLFEQVWWGNLDFLILDLPPGTGDIQLTMTQRIPLTGAVIVTTPQEIALADVRRSIAMFRKVNVDVLGIVENMSYFIPPDAPDKKYFVFGEGGGKKVADESNVDLLGQIPLNMQMREDGDSGKPITISDPESEQAKLIQAITDRLVSKIRNKNFELTKNPGVKISL